MDIVIIVNGCLNLKFLQNLLDKPSGENSKIICADGASKYLVPLGIVPHMLVGDLDSISQKDLDWMKEKGVELKKFPARKNFTDSELALEYAMGLNPKRITIIGAVGSRWDHSIANIMLLKRLLERGIAGRLVDDKNELTITNGQLLLEGKKGEYLSIIPISEEVKGVTLKGLEYPLTDHSFSMGSTLGISNQFKETKATVEVKEGTLLVCKSID
ncbi:thiamine diphosphokinase [Alkaliphilus hydrothermalis]|uniref:Thiamine diphosphokinase n=1 Tax=Alkaliphilus hydrothermalis TaxID=1482730 RepID=A0ABS2NSU9_9FIRM|nr:thiamine diphosphokinase [Alkaliphilus hydrothermalis]MBM7615842.1 thiamine pyrophosphokinase [Alkaliphilus hydrothermalis]